MRRKIIVLAALLFSVCANAQNAVGSWSIQPKVGINLATLTNDDDAKTRVGLKTAFREFGLNADVNSYDFAIPLGVSYEFSHVVLDARYNFSMTDALSVMGETSRNSVFQLTIGYKFGL